MSAPLTPLGARTPHAHPALYAVIGVLSAVIVAGAGWVFLRPQTTAPAPSPTPSETPTAVEYRNQEYGLLVRLPESWRGFTATNETQTGTSIDGSERTETFAVLHIAHPKSTKQAPRQDIPVMVFTHDQWERIQQEKLSVSAAPFPPGELARNSVYVFALPPRYNYSFSEGWEEVESILQTSPVSAFEPAP